MIKNISPTVPSHTPLAEPSFASKPPPFATLTSLASAREGNSPLVGFGRFVYDILLSIWEFIKQNFCSFLDPEKKRQKKLAKELAQFQNKFFLKPQWDVSEFKKDFLKLDPALQSAIRRELSNLLTENMELIKPLEEMPSALVDKYLFEQPFMMLHEFIRVVAEEKGIEVDISVEDRELNIPVLIAIQRLQFI